MELYDLSADPYEEHDLAGQRKYELKLAELKSWVAEIALQMVSSRIFFPRSGNTLALQMVNRQKILPRMWQQAQKLLNLKSYLADSELHLIKNFYPGSGSIKLDSLI